MRCHMSTRTMEITTHQQQQSPPQLARARCAAAGKEGVWDWELGRAADAYCKYMESYHASRICISKVMANAFYTTRNRALP